MNTHQPESDGKRARSWTNRFPESYETGEFCSSPFGRCRISHQFHSSKSKQPDEHTKEKAIGVKIENTLYRSVVAVSPPPSLLEVEHDERPHNHDVAKTSRYDGMDSSPVTMARRTPERDIIQSRCSAPFNLMTITFGMEDGSKDQKWKQSLFAGIVSGVSDQKWRTQPASDCTHCQNSGRKCQPTRAI